MGEMFLFDLPTFSLSPTYLFLGWVLLTQHLSIFRKGKPHCMELEEGFSQKEFQGATVDNTLFPSVKERGQMLSSKSTRGQGASSSEHCQWAT